MSIWGAAWKGDPINKPEMIPLEDWLSYNLKMMAYCFCGRVSEVHTGMQIKQYGSTHIFPDRALEALAPKNLCIRCKARSPELRLEVAK